MKLIFRSKEFLLPSTLGSLLTIDEEIKSILQTKKRYEIKSDVSEKVFQSFINYLINNDIPEIDDSNILEYDKLSEEFNIMKNIINLFKFRPTNEINFSLISKNMSLLKQLEVKKKLLQEKKDNYNQIMLLLKDKYHNFCTSLKTSAEKKSLVCSCTNDKIDELKFLIQPNFSTKDGLTFSIDEENLTATLIDLKEKSTISIPSSINYKSREFTVTDYEKKLFYKMKINKTIIFSNDFAMNSIYDNSFLRSQSMSIYLPERISQIGEYSFSSSLIYKLKFQGNSQLKKIGKFAFYKSSLEVLSIPSSVEEFGEGWCWQTNYLTKIKIKQNNNGKQNLKLFNNSLLIGKSNNDNDDFDVLLFAPRNIEHVKIPHFIKTISSYAFENCIRLRTIEFEENSQLQFINKFAFSETSIEKISIPSHVKVIGESSFKNCENLNEIIFSEDSELEFIENSAFENTSIECISIPKKVTQIYENSFADCEKLIEVRFSNDSELKYINKMAFLRSKISKLAIPSCFSKFMKGWCTRANLLKDIQILESNERNIISYKNEFILGKSNPKNEQFDVLLFANRNITEAIIPSFIKQIGCNAFSSCFHMNSVKFEDNSELEYIDDFAFTDSYSLKEISIPLHVKRIGDYSFFYCKKLVNVEFDPNSKLESIGKSSFQQTFIKSIVIPPKVTRIGELAFSECINLEQIELPRNLKHIERYTFFFTALESISIPSCVEIIDNNAFAYTKNLVNIDFAENSKLKIIGERSFMSSHIRSIKIPSHVAKICTGAFYSSCIQNVSFSDQSELQVIEKDAFCMTSNVSFYFPSNLTKIKKINFNKCGLDYVFLPDQLKEIDDCSFELYSIKELSIPSTFENFNICFNNIQKIDVRMIPNQKKKIKVFDDYILGKLNSNSEIFDVILFCQNGKEKLIIPSFIKKIGENAFQNNSLKEIIFSDNSELIYIGKRAFQYSSIEKITIPKHVKIICEAAFEYCKELRSVEFESDSELNIIENKAFSWAPITKVIIPRNVTTISEHAFDSCQELETVEFEENSKLESIKNHAFYLTRSNNLIIPSSVKIIEENAFNSTDPKKMVFASNSQLRIVEQYAFNSLIENISIPSSVERLCNFCFFDCPQLNTIDFQNDSRMKQIGLTFCNMSFEKITLPSKIIELNEFFLENCSNLTNIVINDSTSMFHFDGKYLLRKSNPNCVEFDEIVFASKNIVDAVIPSSIKRIAPFAFSACKKLVDISFSNDSKLEFIEKNAFSGTKLTKIEIPRHVKKIGQNSFEYNRYLKSVNFMNDSEIKVIDNYSFDNTGLQSFSFPQSIDDIGLFVFSGGRLKIIEIQNNVHFKLNIKLFTPNNPFYLQTEIIMIPPKVSKEII